MTQSTVERQDHYVAQFPASWIGADNLKVVREFNERCLLTVRDWAASHEPCGVPAIADQRELWRQLHPEAIKRAAHFGAVIIDVQFDNAAWWQALDRDVDGAGTRDGFTWSAQFAGPLTNELLVLAWHVSRWDRRTATVLLGMRPEVAEVIAALSPNLISRAAQRGISELRLRWSDRPSLWRSIVTAAQSGSKALLADAHLQAALLLFGSVNSSLDTGNPSTQKQISRLNAR